ncbi:MAG: hypothetical protein WC683_07700 [bacterium]|jgi:hypothetical protein
MSSDYISVEEYAEVCAERDRLREAVEDRLVAIAASRNDIELDAINVYRAALKSRMEQP